ncbi:MAG: GNAT family N-acetyltransferase [Phenylobacterium sp.]|uniref:GNAT family N-acetyltransferase n=1 Tax=Phenylobacterium sp. TaxID=1871053 RepID=UPI002734C158|nr:GNAT family N-acetyltransferase [Phenylobacterium sp.]MDP1640862.1 GNAT family N-acetyltransferase [Phenylobacterium sp.]MDP3115711.1 GNAT family N-acetyltransferase [Phenylobacterium sp.]MDP3382633.1 GNAT family N-acetyltransferase [Phenylobacterium sp.]
MSVPAFAFAPAKAGDLSALTELRLTVMAESFNRIGRFNPDRARAWFADTYRPETTRLIEVEGETAGCVAFYEVEPGVLKLEHFYLDPRWQGRGLGSAILDGLLAEADAVGARVILTVLRQSDAQRLYDRRGFVVTGRDDLDVYMERVAQPTAPA